MIWLGPKRGFLTDYVTQLWVKTTGRAIDLHECPWLEGPVGKPDGIGPDFFEELAKQESLCLQSGHGLLRNFGDLRGPAFDSNLVSPLVKDFYEQTANYELEAWAEWCGLFRPFGHALAILFSRRLQQLNVPLSALDTSRGVESAVVDLVDPATRKIRYTAWMRILLGSKNVLYAGSYSVVRVPKSSGPCVKVVFPLPNGNAVVIMYPKVNEDGSFTITSSGDGFGEPGFYFTVLEEGGVWAKYVAAMTESIRVYQTEQGEVRADHTLRFWGAVFLRLHYRLRPVGRGQQVQPSPLTYSK
jgi:hypothetical protein